MTTRLATVNEALYESKAKGLVEEFYQTDAREFWHRSIAVLQQFAMQSHFRGLVLSHHPHILANPVFLQAGLQTWVFTASKSSLFPRGNLPLGDTQVVQIAKTDDLMHEWFCIMVTEAFSILITSSQKTHSCAWSLHPEAIQSAIAALSLRLKLTAQQELLQSRLQQFPLVMPDYQVMSRFGAILMAQSSIYQELPIPEIQEVDIIKAITHEVRTPLTTIRMLVRSLKRRKDVSTEVKTRLEQVDAECTEQIERFNLIFEAAELDNYPIIIEATKIEEILSDGFLRWREQAVRRQISLEMILPTEIETISSNAMLLSQILNGLVDRLIRSFPADSHIQLILTSAGEYLKLQFQSQVMRQGSGDLPLLKAVGQWLMLQPETGTLSLSLPTTKTLLKALGGKLTVRMHSTSAAYDGEILTIFLPFISN